MSWEMDCMVASPLWWEQTSKAEQTGWSLPQFPLQHHTSLHLLHSFFSTMATINRVKIFHAWGKSCGHHSKRPKRDWERNSTSSPSFYSWPSSYVSYIWRKFSTFSTIIIPLFQILHHAWFPHNWTEFHSKNSPHTFALVPWNKKSMWPPCVSWCVPFWENLWSI